MARALGFLLVFGVLAAGVYVLGSRGAGDATDATDARAWTALLPRDVQVVEWVRIDALDKPEEVNGFDVDPEGRPVLLVGGRVLVRFGRDEQRTAETIPLRSKGPLDDLAWMDDGSLLAISYRTLTELTGAGLEDVHRLPQAEMRMRPASAGQCYLFGGYPSSQALYLYRKGGEILHVLEAEDEIRAVAGDGDFTFIAIDRSVYLMAPEQPLTLVCRAERPITSLALGPDSVLFYATDATVGISTAPGHVVEFLRGRGGRIRVRGNTLFLFSPSKGLMSFSPVSRLVRMAREAGDA